MKKIFIIIACLMLLASAIAANSFIALRNQNTLLSKEAEGYKQKNAELQSEILDLNNKLLQQGNKIETLEKSNFVKSESFYPIYTADIDTYERKIDAYIYISEETALNQKLELLTKALSEAYFDKLPIEILRIEERDSKKVVIINLRESAENQGIIDYKEMKGKTWMMHYMQGSTGGTITTTQLAETMLQKEYEGKWIDGVLFLYENEPCNYEHAGLRDVIYRGN